MKATFTVFFEASFWKGIYEREEKNKLSVAIVIFGEEPKDIEVLQFLNSNFNTLSFSNEIEQKPKIIQNYKRLQRSIKKEVQPRGIGTKSQQALQQQRELMKIERKVKRKEIKQALQKEKFEQKQQKKKQKRKGK